MLEARSSGALISLNGFSGSGAGWLEQGFGVFVVKGTTAAPGTPSWATGTRRQSSISVSWRTRS
jgi:hypothetical protein